jgi:GT2 family glycosyltransferase
LLCDSLLNANDNHLFDIFIVDNSPLQSELLLEFASLYANIFYLRQDENKGYFSGLNFGINSINVEDYSFVVVGNNDLEYDSSFIRSLYLLKFKNNVQVICPDVITIDGVHQNPHHLYSLSKIEIFMFDCYFSSFLLAKFLVTLKNIFKSENKFVSRDKFLKEELVEINQGVGACYVLTMHFFEKHKELFFPFFLYGEEAVLSWQIRNSAGIMCFAPSLKVLHAESATLSSLPKKTTYNYARDSYWKLRKYLK